MSIVRALGKAREQGQRVQHQKPLSVEIGTALKGPEWKQL